MSNELELEAATHDAIKALCAQGDRLARAKSHEAAVAEYSKAWMLVPEPKTNWQASTWILTAIVGA